MASMDRSANYMQEASREGFAIRDSCTKATATSGSPRSTVRVRSSTGSLIEEKAQGGGHARRLARRRPSFLDGTKKICDGAGLGALSKGRWRTKT